MAFSGLSDEISPRDRHQMKLQGVPDLFGFRDFGSILGPWALWAPIGPQNGAGKLEMLIKKSCGEVSRGSFSRGKVRIPLIKGLAIIFPQIAQSGTSFTGILYLFRIFCF